MRMGGRRLAPLLLALLLSAELAGCGGEAPAAEPDLLAVPWYTQEAVPLPVETGELHGCCAAGEHIWLLITGEGEAAARLLRLKPAEGKAEELTAFQPLERREDFWVSCQGPFPDPEGALWIYEGWTETRYDLPADFDPDRDGAGKADYFVSRERGHALRQLDPQTGRTLRTVDLSAAMEALGEAGLCGLTVDKGGTICLSDGEKVIALDRDGQPLFTLEAETAGPLSGGTAGGALALLPDGRTAALAVLPGGKREVRIVDPRAGDWGETLCALPDGIRGLHSGQSPWDFYYVREGVLCGLLPGETLPRRLLSLADTGVKYASGPACFLPLEDGRLALLTRGAPEKGGPGVSALQLSLLMPSDRPPEEGKTRILYGAVGEDSQLLQRIRAFNEENDAYYVEYRDYSEGGYAAAAPGAERIAAADAARKRIRGEIAAGRIPDILDDSLPLEAFGRAGLLEDLWPWIEGDPAIGREGVMAHVLDCASTGGALYRIASGFHILTAAAGAEVAGGRTGWTMEELLAAYGGGMPDILEGTSGYLLKTSGARMLRNLLRMDLARYVDWETGECRFEGAAFRDVLRLCAGAEDAAPAEGESPRLWENPPVLCGVQLSRLDDFFAWDVLFGGPETLVDYEARLWEAGVLTAAEGDSGSFVSYRNAPESVALAALYQESGYYGFSRPLAGGAVTGAPDGECHAAFPGFPAQSGTGSGFVLDHGAAVSASSPNKEGAWAFLRFLLLPGGNLWSREVDGKTFSHFLSFPISRPDFQQMLEPRWCRKDRDGELLLDPEGNPVEAAREELTAIGTPVTMLVYQLSPTQAQLDRFWALYHAIDRIGGGDQTLLDIICEQAQPYFAGDKGLEETAGLIQRRAQLYVNENK